MRVHVCMCAHACVRVWDRGVSRLIPRDIISLLAPGSSPVCTLAFIAIYCAVRRRRGATLFYSHRDMEMYGPAVRNLFVYTWGASAYREVGCVWGLFRGRLFDNVW